MFDLEHSITQWLKQFSKHRAFDHGSLREMELHIRDHIDDLIGDGCDPKEAFDRATKEFGEIPAMADEAFSNHQRRRSLGAIVYATLFKNYYKTSLRGMMRNPMSSFINIVGLSAAIGVCVFTYGFAQWTYRTDQFHENKNSVYLATFFADLDGTLHENGQSHLPLGESLKRDFPQVKSVCRIEHYNAVVKYDDKVFHERPQLVDPSFFSLFTFPLKWGLPNTLKDPNSVVLSERASKKYFGEANPIGQELLIRFEQERSKTFVISGVAKKFPQSRSYAFDFLINFENIRWLETDYDAQDWSVLIDATFVHVDNPSQLQAIKGGMIKYKKLQNEIEDKWAVESFDFQQLATLHQNSSAIRNSISSSTDDGYTSIIFLVFVGVFLLTLACFNYINIAIVSASKRLKEIGIRKTIGANKRAVIVQFLGENLISTSFALGFGLLLGAYLFIPWFEGLFAFDMGFSFYDLDLWIYLPLVLCLTALASGFYPALYISKFPVTGILRGSLQFGKKNPLTRIILGFQLVMACMFITSAVMFTQNSNYLLNRDWGYEKEVAMYTKVPDQSGFDRLRARLLQDPNILIVAGSEDHLGVRSQQAVIERPDRNYEVNQLSVGPNYFQTMGIAVKAGRVFDRQLESDKSAVIVNQLLVDNLGLNKPVGKVLKIDSSRYTIVGVVTNVHADDFSAQIQPTIFMVADDQAFRFLTLKVNSGMQREAYVSLQESWSELFPEIPFQGSYQEDVWGGYYREIGIHGKVWRAIATIAILVAALGLYGLVTLNVSGRIREFSIRKVLGANLNSLGLNITREYATLFIVSIAIGAPISYFLLDFILDFAYTYHIPMNTQGVLLAVAILVLVLITVVGIQVAKLAKSNPINGLKVE